MQIPSWRLAIIGAVASGVVLLGALRTPVPGSTAPQPIVPQSDRTIVPQSESTAVTQAARNWTLQIDEATLAGQVNTVAVGQALGQTPLGDLRLHDITVALRDNLIGVGGTADAAWVRAPFDATAGALVSGGRVLVQVHTAHLGGVDVPNTARSSIEQQLQNQLDELLTARQVLVSSVSMVDGSLVVTGTGQ
jgi:hypothetical protein